MIGWLRMLRAELPLLRNLPDFGDRPLPRIEADLGPALPGWVVRAASVLVTATMVGIAAHRTTLAAGPAWSLVGMAAAATAILPAAAVAQVAVVASGLLLALGGHGPFDPAVFALVPLAYASVRLAWWSQRLPLAARVEIAALTRGLPRALAFTGGTLALAGVAFLLTGRPNPFAVVAGGAALVGLTWLVVLRPAAPDRVSGQAVKTSRSLHQWSRRT